MINAAKVINLIQRTSGYNDKKYLLKKNENVEGLKDILRFIYDPYNKTGISKAKLEKALNMGIEANETISYKDIMQYLKTHNTGSTEDLIMAARFIDSVKKTYADYPFAIEVAKAIVTQDLQIGITAKTLNTVYGKSFIPTIGCMLGTNIEQVPEHKINWPCIVTEKLDGVRRILIKEKGKCRFFSRSGHEDTGLVDILKEAEYLPDNRVYDGELLAEGTFANSVAQRQATNALASKKGEKHGLTFNIFDMLPVEEFYAGKSEDSAFVRKMILGATFMDDSISLLNDDQWPKYMAMFGMHRQLRYIKAVPILGFVKCLADVEPIVADIWARGGEGVMLNVADAPYEVKRSKYLLKMKHTEEYTLKVVDMIEGTGKYEGMLGALVVDYNGQKLGIGSGFTDDQRLVIWQNPDKYLGRYVEIDTFGESTNKQGTKSLNCPIFKRFVEEVE